MRRRKLLLTDRTEGRSISFHSRDHYDRIIAPPIAVDKMFAYRNNSWTGFDQHYLLLPSLQQPSVCMVDLEMFKNSV